MDKPERSICSRCPLYACRLCRTKTGWPHQRWCPLADMTEPSCGDCRYRNPRAGACAHPGQGKGGATDHEKLQYSL